MYFLAHFLAPKGKTEKTEDGIDSTLSLFATFVCVYIYIYIYKIFGPKIKKLFIYLFIFMEKITTSFKI